MRLMLCVVLLCVSGYGFFWSHQARASDLYTSDWSSGPVLALDRLGIPPKDVEKLFDRLIISYGKAIGETGSRSLNVEWLASGASVCSYSPIGLPASSSSSMYPQRQASSAVETKQTFALVVLVKTAMTGKCDRLLVITKNDKKSFIVSKIDTPDVSLPITDTQELISRDTDASAVALEFHLGFYVDEGKYADDCTASYPLFYVWKEKTFVADEVASRKALQNRLLEMQELSVDQSAGPCLQMEKDKMVRILAMSPTAGFSRAIEWTRSPDPKLRKKALIVFRDIHDVASLQELDLLTKDHDPEIANLARAELIAP